jgi:kojibiose phosphorylase
LQHAALIYRQLQETQPAVLATLAEQLQLDEAEVQTWERMAKLVFLPAPYPHTLLIEQFDGYFELEGTTPEVVKSR